MKRFKPNPGGGPSTPQARSPDKPIGECNKPTTEGGPVDFKKPVSTR